MIKASDDFSPSDYKIDPSPHLGLVWKEVLRTPWRWAIDCTIIDQDDLIAAGYRGLCKAATKFDVARGYKFSTYAMYWIKNYISREVKNNARTIKVPDQIQKEMYKAGEHIPTANIPLTPESIIQNPEIDEEIDRKSMEQRVIAALEVLTPRQKEFIVLKFFKELEPRLIAKVMGITNRRCLELQAEAFERLREELSSFSE